MVRARRLACMASIIALLIGGAVSQAAHAGGSTLDEDDNTGANDGPSFFGFVRDSGGSAVPGAHVTAAPKEGGSLVATSNSMGVYKFPGFAKEINPNTVAISCSKDGYAQTDAVRRSPPGDSKNPIEIDCTLQKQ
jgi:hypothetical protein